MTVEMTIADTQAVALSFARSGLFSGIDPESAFVAILAGREMGLAPFQSVSGIHIIKGKPVLSAGLLAGLVKASAKYDYRVIVLSDEVCELAFYERGERVGVSTFGLVDAKAAGLLRNPTWRAYPRNMNFARAVSNGIRWYCPDITMISAYHEGELDAPPARTVEVVEPQPAPMAPHLEIFLAAAKRIAVGGRTVREICAEVVAVDGAIREIAEADMPGVIERMVARETALACDEIEDAVIVRREADAPIAQPEAVDPLDPTRTNAHLHAAIGAVAKVTGGGIDEVKRNRQRIHDVAHLVVREMSGVGPDAAWSESSPEAMVGVARRLQSLGMELHLVEPERRQTCLAHTIEEWRADAAR